MGNDIGTRIILFLGVLLVVGCLGICAIDQYLAITESNVRTRSINSWNNLREAVAALEAYRVDHGVYPTPQSSADGWMRLPGELTTPTAYMASLPVDVFDPARGTYGFGIIAEDPARWSGVALVPDRQFDYVLLGLGPTQERGPFRLSLGDIYDPSNGTFSGGYISRFGPGD